jgi:hypothetical protein
MITYNRMEQNMTRPSLALHASWSFLVIQIVAASLDRRVYWLSFFLTVTKIEIRQIFS